MSKMDVLLSVNRDGTVGSIDVKGASSSKTLKESYERGCQEKSFPLSLRERRVMLSLASSPISILERRWARGAFRTGQAGGGLYSIGS